MKIHEVRSGEVRLHVVEQGPPQAPCVLLVHGYPDTHAMWDPVAELLEERWRVVRYDVRGAGASTAPGHTAGYALSALAGDLRAVLDAVSPDHRQVHLVGHDWGSIQCWEAVTEPALAGRFASFTSMSGPCLDHAALWMRKAARGPLAARRRLARQLLHSGYIAFFQAPVLPELLWRAGLARGWPTLLRLTEGVRAGTGHPAPTLPADARRGVRLYRANFRARMRRPRERRTTVPVQVVAPLRDRYVTPALTEDTPLWAPVLERHEPAAGHWVTRSRPELVAELVDAFARRVAAECARRA